MFAKITFTTIRRYIVVFMWGGLALYMFLIQSDYLRQAYAKEINSSPIAQDYMIFELDLIQTYLSAQPTQAMLLLRKAQIHSLLHQTTEAMMAFRAFIGLEPNLLLSQHLRM